MSRHLLWIPIFSLLMSEACVGQETWPRFRGPNGTGVSDAATRVPVSWTEEDYNWKIELPGTGHGSPVVWGDRIFLTCGAPETARRTLLCLDAADGHVVWRRDYPSKDYKQHRHNHYASSTPAVDADGLVVTWTTPQAVVLLALDHQGNERWRRDLGPFVAMHGSGTSPVIVGDLVVLANDQEDLKILARLLGREEPPDPPGESFLVALDRRTGQTRWRIPRETTLAAYSTPCVRQFGDGQSELIFTSSPHGITAVDPATGKINWELDGIFPDRCVGSPVLASGLVIAGFGYGARGTRYVAVRPGSRAEGLEPKIVYDVTKSVPLVPTPLVHRDKLFLWADDGVVTCLHASTGKILWRERVGGSFYGSPVCVADRLYCIARSGEMVVLDASEKFEILARVPLGEPSYATPAVSSRGMLMRTHSHLFSLGGAKP